MLETSERGKDSSTTDKSREECVSTPERKEKKIIRMIEKDRCKKVEGVYVVFHHFQVNETNFETKGYKLILIITNE